MVPVFGEDFRKIITNVRQVTHAMFRSIVENAPACILAVDETGTVTYCNKSAEQLFRHRVETVLGAPIAALMPGAEMRDGQLILATQHSDFGVNQTILETPDKGTRYLEVRQSRYSEDNGPMLNIVRLADVSLRVQAQMALRAQEQRWNVALRGSQIGVFESDLLTGEGKATDTWFHLLGVEDPEGHDSDALWHAAVHPDDRLRVIEADAACEDGLTERSETKYRILHKDGTWRTMHSVLMVAERDSMGKAVRLLGTMSDITELQQATDRARAREEELRQLIERTPIPMTVMTRGGRFLIVNEACERLLGYSADELQRQTLWSLTDNEALAELQREVAEMQDDGSGVHSSERVYERPDGTKVDFAIRVTKLSDNRRGRGYLVAQMLDITEQKRVDRLKDDFIATVSHELRTPLASISGALGLLRVKAGDALDEQSRHLLEIAGRNGQRLKELVDDLLDFQRLATGGLSLEMEPVEILSVVQQAVEETQPLAQKFDVSIQIETEDSLFRAEADPKRLKQVIVNLLSNAAKFSPSQDRVLVKVQRAGGDCHVAVTNHGRGISPEFRQHIFRPFSQQAVPETRDREGSGLGLAITKGLVDRMHGRIGYDSVPNERTTFWVRFPMSRDEGEISRRAG